MMVHDRLLEMVDLYALDALPPEEQIEVERHMEGCPACEAELADALSVTAALIPDSEPPNHVWDRIVWELDAGPVVIRRLRNTHWTAIATIAAAIVIVLAGLLIMTSDGRVTLVAAAETARAETGSMVASLTQGDVTLAEVILTAEGQGYVLPTESLVSLDVSRTYQLWVITADEEVVSAGVLGNAPGPAAFTWDGEVSGFALTREVAGGVPVSAGDVVSVVTGL
jgi:anti-sigma-K factor RskA